MDVENVKMLKLGFMIITSILSYNNNNLSKIIIDHKKYDYEIFYPTACITGFVFLTKFDLIRNTFSVAQIFFMLLEFRTTYSVVNLQHISTQINLEWFLMTRDKIITTQRCVDDHTFHTRNGSRMFI